MSNIEGYSIQNGEPTPDNPVEIENLELNAIDIVNLKDISERFNNGTETIEDIINYCRNYELHFGSKITMRVVEKKYFNKLVERIKELEAELEFKQWGDLDNIDFEEYMKNFISKEKVKDEIKKHKIAKEGFEKEYNSKHYEDDNVRARDFYMIVTEDRIIQVLENLLEDK